MSGPFAELGVCDIINAAGKMTYLGSSAPHPEVTAAMTRAAARYVDMAELKAAVGRRIAELAGAPAGWVVSCAAAGIAQCVAGAITGTDPALVEAVPDGLPERREVVLQKGHAVHFGAPLAQMLRMAGARVREVGTVSRTERYHLTLALGDRTAAVVFVVSHHTGGSGALDLATVVELAHTAGVPVIVDAAAEVDLRRYLDAGADVAIYSGHKAISGPTSGLVLGTPELVAACAAQEAGIGRTMKLGKESLAGILVAVERYVAGQGTRDEAELRKVLAQVEDGLAGTVPADLAVVWDATRPIPRLRLTVRADAPLDAVELVRRLEAHDPSVRTRNHAVVSGVIEIDPRELSIADAEELAATVRQVFAAAGSTS
jgi:uncharacterized pyridoxal phosphate-dependent enzyme